MTEFWSSGRLRNGAVVIAGSLLLLQANAWLAIGLAPLAAITVLAATAASAWLIVRMCHPVEGSWLARPVNNRRLVSCLVLALALCLLGGECHLFFANDDWLIREAVLGDLVRRPFPVTYLHEGKTYLLRAPLGMYLLPAAVGKLLGIGAAHAAMLAQNATLLGLFFYLFVQSARIPAGWFLGLFITFGSLSVIPCVLAGYALTGHFWLRPHPETVFLNFQYMSPVTQIFWAPNHALPGWWLTALLIGCKRGQVPLAIFPLLLAGLCLWSPLALVGAFVVGLVVVAPKAGELLRSRLWWAACAVAAGFIPVLLYLIVDAAAIPQGWNGNGDGLLTFTVAVFLIFSVPHLLLIAGRWSNIDADLKSMMFVSAIMLLVLPWLRFGPNNDLLFRGAIVPLALLAAVFSTMVYDFFSARMIVHAVIAALIVVVGGMTPLLEIRSAIVEPPFTVSSCNLLTAWSQTDPDNWIPHYMANVERAPQALLRVDTHRAPLSLDHIICWPDHPHNPLPFDYNSPREGLPPQPWPQVYR